MRLARTLMLVSTLLLFAGSASATPVDFTFVSAELFDPGFDTTQSFTPSLPIVDLLGNDVDEVAGTYTLTLPTFGVNLDIGNDGLDAILTTTSWSQMGSWTPGAGPQPITPGGSATGTTTCAVQGGSAIGGIICNGLGGPPPYPAAVDPWPPTGASGPTLGAPGATIDTTTNTIVVISAYDVNGGQVRSTYTYADVPEPGTLLLVGTGLFGLLLSGRRRA